MFEFGDYSLNHSYREILLQHFGSVGDVMVYRKDTLIEFEYNKLGHVYFILEGKVKQYFTNVHGQEKTFLILTKGDMFGEVTMLQNDHDHCITRTYSDAKIARISRQVFDSVLQEHPQLQLQLMLMLTTKIRLLMYQIFDGNYLDAKEKLYALLQRLSMQHGAPQDDGTLINLDLTHEELARMIGSTRSTVTKMINQLAGEDKILRLGKQLVVL